jgi:hypothetical protein
MYTYKINNYLENVENIQICSKQANMVKKACWTKRDNKKYININVSIPLRVNVDKYIKLELEI